MVSRTTSLISTSVRGNFSGDHCEAACQQGFHGDAAFDILRQQGIENGIADLIGQLIGMALRNGL